MNAFDSSHARSGPYRSIAAIGAGAWGTALAAVAARAGRRVKLYARREEIAEDVNANRRNARYLDDAALPEGLVATSDLAVAVRDADAVLLVTPSAAVRETARALSALVAADTPIVLCAKGVEPETGMLMSDVVREEMPNQAIAALSGPTFADEVARELPTAVVVASEMDPHSGERAEDSIAARLALALSAGAFRAYVSDDLVGVEIGGAMKNVIAIACGVARGAGFRSNMTAALISRGLAEMTRLAGALGGRPDTIAGLSGLGDLTLTCSSEQSRNLRFGLQLGAGMRREETFGGAPVVVEGVRNAVSVTDLARIKGLHLPICESVRRIVHDGADVAATMGELWSRPLEAEPRMLDLSLRHPDPAQAREKIEELMA